MSLRDIAARDGQAIIKRDGDSLTLTPPSPALPFTVPALISAAGGFRDGAGMVVSGAHRGATFSSLDLAAAGYSPDAIRGKHWTASGTDVQGVAFSGEADLVLVDDNGDITITIKDVE